jgi:hypothetical protein
LLFSLTCCVLGSGRTVQTERLGVISEGSFVEFYNFVLSAMEDGLQVYAVYTEFFEGFRESESWVVVGHVDSKIPWFDDFLDGFLFDRSYTMRSRWRLVA